MNNSIQKIKFYNEHCSSLNDTIDLFISCIGYEDRSFYAYNKLKKRLNLANLLLFAVEDYSDYPSAKAIIDEEKDRGVNCIIVKYSDTELVQKTIIDRIEHIIETNKTAKIHIDYSSMPRSWYCKLPELLSNLIPILEKVYFWYSEGEYLKFENEYPTAGIDSYVLYSGKPSLLERKRTHFIGVGYDSIRTIGIITLLNPESVITCSANNPTRVDVLNKVESVNKEIINESFMNLSLNITDVEFMIAKITGIVNEIYTIAQSDIVLIPDGPKPLIFTMSMIPWIIGEPGISCLHIIRNNSIFKPNNVKPLGNDYSQTFSDADHIIGFSLNNCL